MVEIYLKKYNNKNKCTRSMRKNINHNSPNKIQFSIKPHNVLLVVYLLICIFPTQNFVNGKRIEILMSNVSTQIDDAYMCTSYKLEDDDLFISKSCCFLLNYSYILKLNLTCLANIQPLANAEIAHHMFAYGCEKPSVSSKSWNCGTNVCQGQKSILFAWGRNAPALQLPEGNISYLS
jgi:hypothetical protein